jgi:Transglycosylase-like domain
VGAGSRLLWLAPTLGPVRVRPTNKEEATGLRTALPNQQVGSQRGRSSRSIYTMRKSIAVLAVSFGALLMPGIAQADSPICHNGVLSDDAGMNCADGLYAAAHGSSSATATASAVCSNGVLSDDRGQNCPDGMYERVYGTARASSTHTASGTGTEAALSTGGFSVPPASIAECESGGNPTTNTGNGFYGKWQFTAETWRAVTGLPGTADQYSEATQDAAAAKLYRNGAGAGNWPVCSQR